MTPCRKFALFFTLCSTFGSGTSVFAASDRNSLRLLTQEEVVEIWHNCRESKPPDTPIFRNLKSVNRDLHEENGYIRRVAWFHSDLQRLDAKLTALETADFRLHEQDDDFDLRFILTSIGAIADAEHTYQTEAAKALVTKYLKHTSAVLRARDVMRDTEKVLTLRDTILDRVHAEWLYVLAIYAFAADDVCGIAKQIGAPINGCFRDGQGASEGFPFFILPSANTVGTSLGFDWDANLDFSVPIEVKRAEMVQELTAFAHQLRLFYEELRNIVRNCKTEEEICREMEASYGDGHRGSHFKTPSEMTRISLDSDMFPRSGSYPQFDIDAFRNDDDTERKEK